MADKPFDPTLKTLVDVGPDHWTVFAGQPAAPTRIIDATLPPSAGIAVQCIRLPGDSRLGSPPDQLLAGGLGTLPLAPISAVTEGELFGIIKQMEKRLRRREVQHVAGQLWAATYILLGLRHSPTAAQTLLQGVLSMKESTTYQAILQEGLREGLVKGAVKEARKLLLRLGGKRLGRPSARTQAALAKIADLGQLETLIERLELVDRCYALLAAVPEGR